MANVFRVCYTYYVTFTHPSDGSKLRYYGSRTGRGCHPDDLGVTYFTSSRYVNRLIREHGLECFEWEIHDTFGVDRLSCLDYEAKMIDFLGAVKSPDWLNASNRGTSFNNAFADPMSTEGRASIAESNRRRKGVPHREGAKTKERGRRVSPNKGKSFSAEWRAALTAAALGSKRGTPTDKARANISASLKGIHKGDKRITWIDETGRRRWRYA